MSILSHFDGRQWRKLNELYWDDLLPYVVSVSTQGKEFYDTNETIEWLVNSVKIGKRLATSALFEQAAEQFERRQRSAK